MPRHEIYTEERWFCLRRVHGNIESERPAFEDDMRFLPGIRGSHMVCRRKVYVTPKSYLDLISGLAGVGKVWGTWKGDLETWSSRRNHPYEGSGFSFVAFWSRHLWLIIPQVFT